MKYKYIPVPGFLAVILLVCCSFFSQYLVAQEDPGFRCGFDQQHQLMMQSDPEYRMEIERYELLYQQKMRKDADRRGVTQIFTLPVVVHVIHAGQPLGSDQNPTEADVYAAVQNATDRFRHMHTGAADYPDNPFYGPDTEIELCMAQLDPDGNYTSGVTRHYDPDNSVGSVNDLFPELDDYTWDKDEYINMFIVNDITDAGGVYIGGSFDFTIYDAVSFSGGLINHEVGHQFSLQHTFQDACPNDDCLTDGDKVCDTPPKLQPGLSGPCSTPGNWCDTDDDDTSINNPYRPVADGGMGDQDDMLANYMDYTSPCWDAFTDGQKDRMRLNISTLRMSNVNNEAVCDPQPLPEDDAGITVLSVNQANSCSDSFSIDFTVKNYGDEVLTSVTIYLELDDDTVKIVNWTGSLATDATESVLITDPSFQSPPGELLVRASTNLPNGQTDGYMYNDEAYAFLIYYGGDSCTFYSDCMTFSGTTADGPGNPTLITVSASFPVLDPPIAFGAVCVTAEGDVGHPIEIFNVYGEDLVLLGQTNESGNDCSGPSPLACFPVAAATLNAWAADGNIEITVDPVNNQINPTFCGTNEACAHILFPVQSAPDTGCTDPGAHNYDPNATVDDGSCINCTDGLLNGDETDIDCGGALCPPCPIDSCNFVYKLVDGVPGSLNFAIDCSSDGDTIWFTPSLAGDTIYADGNPFQVDKNLVFIASAGDHITVSGQNTSAAFLIDSGKDVEMHGLYLQSSQANPGKVVINAGNLLMVEVNIIGARPQVLSQGVLFDNSGTIKIMGESNIEP